MSRTAVIVNPASTLGRYAADALVAGGWTIIDLGDGSDEAWQGYLSQQAISGERVNALITAPPGDATDEDTYAAVATAWRGAKYALPLFAEQAEGIVLTLAFDPPPHGSVAGIDASAESIRLLTAAAMLDARAAGIRLRSNRLYCAQAASADAVGEAVRFFTDERSCFQTGAEITLSPSHHGAHADLRDRTVLVTGATSGIGRAAATEIGRLGGWVAVGGRKRHLAEETLAMVRAAGGEGMVVDLDVTHADAWAAAAHSIASARGVLHGLVNNAGEARNRPISALESRDLAFLMDINCGGVRLGINAMTSLLEKEGGTVLNIASVAGVRAGPGGSAYSASKAAMIGLSRGYAAQFRAAGNDVRVNSVLPGFIWSDSVAESLGEEGALSFRAMIEPKTPLGRVGAPHDVASVIGYLLSDAAAGLTGQTITVSGGLELNFP